MNYFLYFYCALLCSIVVHEFLYISIEFQLCTIVAHELFFCISIVFYCVLLWFMNFFLFLLCSIVVYEFLCISIVFYCGL